MDRIKLYQGLLLLPSLAYATTTTTTTATASGTAPAFPSMSGQDGFGVPAGGVGSTATTASDGGSAGSDSGSAWSLSTGAIVGIIVGIIVVIAAIAGMWFLWYMAKKRQWTIRESIRRASRRVVGLKNPPRTPKTPRPAPRDARSARRTTVYNKQTDVQIKELDLERGQPNPGWLADEKERSLSRSSEEDSKRSTDSRGGPAGKVGFANR